MEQLSQEHQAQFNQAEAIEAMAHEGGKELIVRDLIDARDDKNLAKVAKVLAQTDPETAADITRGIRDDKERFSVYPELIAHSVGSVALEVRDFTAEMDIIKDSAMIVPAAKALGPEYPHIAVEVARKIETPQAVGIIAATIDGHPERLPEARQEMADWLAGFKKRQEAAFWPYGEQDYKQLAEELAGVIDKVGSQTGYREIAEDILRHHHNHLATRALAEKVSVEDPRGGFEILKTFQIDGLKPGFHDGGDAVRIAKEIAEIAPESAVEMAKQAPESQFRLELLQELEERVPTALKGEDLPPKMYWKRLIVTDPEVTPELIADLAHAQEIEDRGGGRGTYTELLSQLAANNPEAATAEAMKIDSKKIRTPLIQGIAEVRPDLARPLIEEVKLRDSVELYYPSLAIGLAKSDPVAAKELLIGEYGDDPKWPVKVDAYAPIAMKAFKVAAGELAESSPEEALDLAERSPFKSRGYIDYQNDLLLSIADRVPEAGRIIIDNLQSSERVEFRNLAMITKLAKQYPDLASAAIEQIYRMKLPNDAGSASFADRARRERQTALVGIAESLQSGSELQLLNALQVKAFANELRFSLNEDAVDYSFVQRAYAQNPTSAKELCAGIEDARVRGKLLVELTDVDHASKALALEVAREELNRDSFGDISLMASLLEKAAAGGDLEFVKSVIDSDYPEKDEYAHFGDMVAQLGRTYPEFREFAITTLQDKEAISSLATFIDDPVVRQQIAEQLDFSGRREFAKNPRSGSQENLVKNAYEVDPAVAGSFIHHTGLAWKILNTESDENKVAAFIGAIPGHQARAEAYLFALERNHGISEHAIAFYNDKGSWKIESKSYMGQLGAAIIMVQQREGTGAERQNIYKELMGETSLIASPMAETDRSFNFNAITRDQLDANPGLIDVVATQIINPAQFKSFTRHLELLAGDDVVKKAQYFYQVTSQMFATDQSKTMTLRYRAEKQRQADGGEQANHDLYKQLPSLRNILAIQGRAGERTMMASFEKGYTMANLIDHPWLMRQDVLEKDKFPADGNRAEQAVWLADNSFVKLQGYNRRSIGQIISNRLANNLETSLHDATEWLGMLQVGSGRKIEVFNAETGLSEEKQLYADSLELELLGCLMSADKLSPAGLRRLPGFEHKGNINEINISKIEGLLHDPLNILTYAAMMRVIRKQTEGTSTLNAESVIAEINADEEGINEWLGKSKDMRSIDQDYDIAWRVHTHFNTRMPIEDAKLEHVFGDVIQQLRVIGKDRKAYIDGATTWLKQYQNTSSETLTRAWKERAFALENGVEDNPNKIVEWSKGAAFARHVKNETDAKGRLPSGEVVSEFLARHESYIAPLASRYSAAEVMDTLTKLDRLKTKEADLPAATIDLGDGYSFRVIGKDSPDGFTIGHDTDCCMTVGGISESCIWAGYSDKRFGFSALYHDGQLLAQSFIWHNDGPEGDTLVLDNIEAQRGRSVEKIAELNQRAWELYLAKLPEIKPEIKIDAVNLGTQYTEGGITDRLVLADAVEMPQVDGLLSIYSDARNQLKLVRLTEERRIEIATSSDSGKVVFEESKVETQNRPEISEIIPFDGSDEAIEMIAVLERQAYPFDLQTGSEDLAEDLRRPDNYSFIIKTTKGNSEIDGYVVAYKDYTLDAIYVADMAINPTIQRAGLGIAAIRHLLERAKADEEATVYFEARENTSYRALQSPSVIDALTECGYEISSTEFMEGHFDNGESAYLVKLNRLTV